MTDREQFEAAMIALADQPEESFDKPYGSDDVNAHWAVWKIARAQALEEAAAKLEADYVSAALSPVTVLDCIDFIRALSKE